MKVLFPIIGALSLAVSSCATDTGGLVAAVDTGTLLASLASNVILATYADVEVSTSSLTFRMDQFNSVPSEANLAIVRNQWSAAHRYWEQSQAFHFGPVVTLGLDARMDTRPVNRAALEAILASSVTLDHDYIYGLDGTLQGFHAMEYLLFGVSGSKTLTDFTARERLYLLWTSDVVGQAGNALHSEWVPRQDYEHTFISLNRSSLLALVNGMVAICDTVANAKISIPFDQGDRSLEESPFSSNSVNDFVDNIRGVQNIYLGKYGSKQGMGLRALVLAGMPGLDPTIQAQLNAAIAAISNITPTFGEAISASPAKVEAARARVRELKQTLEAQLLPLVQ